MSGKLNGSRVFSVIDLRDAYLQIPTADEFRASRKSITENTLEPFNFATIYVLESG